LFDEEVRKASFYKWEVKMKKILVPLLVVLALLSVASAASAHGWRGGNRGVWHGGWAPLAAGAVAGVVVTNTYQRPIPVYYGPNSYYYPQQNTAAYCPENGLYYPQTQVCPSGWQRVIY
jgi:hypothetical protein